jgi:hypothetical protein
MVKRTFLYLLVLVEVVILFSCTEAKEKIDTVPPTITWISPSVINANVSGIYTLEVKAYDNNLMASVVFLLHNDTLGVAQRHAGDIWSFNWDTHQYNNGDSLPDLDAVAMDQVGLINHTGSRQVKINNIGVPPLPSQIAFIRAPNVKPYFDKYRLEIFWTKSKDANFGHYLLLRDSLEFTTQGDRVFHHIYARDSVNFIDNLNNMDVGRYYYAVIVVDDSLPSALSNVDYGEIGVLTDTVTVNIDAVAKHAIALRWDKTDDFYFKNYLIYRSESDIIDTSIAPIAIINSRFSINHNDANLKQTTNYTYGLVIEDTRGVKYLTNSVSGETLPLEAVELNNLTNIGKYEITLNWNPSSDNDVLGYRVIHSHNGNSEIVAELDGRLISSYHDVNLNQDTDYTYTLITIDSLEEKTSVEKTGRTQKIVPVTLLSAQSGDYNVTINWSQYSSPANDFVFYDVQRRITGSWETLTSIDTKATLQYSDNNGDYGTIYEYAITVRDTNGGVAQSNSQFQHVRELYRVNVNDVTINESGNLIVNWAWANQSEAYFDHYELVRYSNLYVRVNGNKQYLIDNIPNPLPHVPFADDSVVVQVISGASTQQFIDTGVTHNSGLYGYRILVVDGQGNFERGNMSGNYEGEGILPEQVQLNAATNITSHSASLNWNTTQPGNTYHIYSDFYADSLSLEGSNLHMSVTGSTNATIENLQSGLRYYFCIWTEDNYGNISDQSNIIEVETLF